MSEPNHTASLHLAHQNLLHLLGSIHKTPLSRFRFVAPIIDRNNPDGWRQEDLQGFKKFMEGLECLRVFLDGVSCFSTVQPPHSCSLSPHSQSLSSSFSHPSPVLSCPPLLRLPFPLSRPTNPSPLLPPPYTPGLRQRHQPPLSRVPKSTPESEENSTRNTYNRDEAHQS